MPNHGRAGSAGLLVLFVLAIALGFGAWLLLSAPGSSSAGPAAVRDSGEPAPEDSLAAAGSAASDASAGPRAISNVEFGEAGRYAQMGRVFEGTGTIVGEIKVDPSVVYPETWTLTVEPSHIADGRERAITRVIKSEPGQRTFELRDLPMAAYRLRAEAPGMASMAQEIPLFKIEGHEELPGMNHVNATVKLYKIAYVDGAVRTANGDVADDLPVFLVDQRDREKPALETRTDIAGRFRFDSVRNGAWLLHVGDAVRPLVAPIPVNVINKAFRLDDVALPALAWLEMIVVDEYGRPFPDVDLVGYLRGTGRGSFRTKTGALGTAAVRYLSPGPWRVEASYALEGQKGKADLALSVDDDPSTVHEIHIR